MAGAAAIGRGGGYHLSRTREWTSAWRIGIWLAAAQAMPGAGPDTAEAPAAQSTSTQNVLAPDDEVLAKLAARPDEPARAFRARRRLEITSAALKKGAWLEVQVDLDPRDGFRYRVLAAGGSEMLQRKILHKVLRAEQEVYARGDDLKTALTTDNYVFLPGGRDERGLVRLVATARRKDVGLLNGHFLVTPDTADVVEVPGTMAEAPSFWIPRVDITKRYARVRGHRVNVRVDSVSHVRLLGESRFTMTTEYESIDGDAVLSLGAVAAREP